MKTLKRVAKSLVRTPVVGVPATVLAHSLGWTETSVRIGKLCCYKPRRVAVDIGQRQGVAGRFLMITPDGTDQIAKSVWYKGWQSLERPMPQIFAALSAEGGIALDVGANTGFYSLLMAASSTRMVVHAFEPFAAARELLQRNAAASGLADRIVVNAAALSRESGQMQLYVPVPIGAYVEMSASLNPTFRKEHERVVSVRTWSMDDYVKAHIPTGRVTLMKIDVEGHEDDVLQGARLTLDTHRPVFCLEILSPALAEVVERRLGNLDYQCFLLRERRLQGVSRIAMDECAKNQLFCPSERMAELRERLKPAGIHVAAAG